MQGLVQTFIQPVSPLSGDGYITSSVYSPVYPVPTYGERATVTRHPEYVFVARCKNCHREFHLDSDVLIPPAFCGLGMTHGCGSSDWHVFKRGIEVEEEPEYVDDCVYSDMQVTKQHRLVGAYAEPGCVTLPPMTRKKVSTLRIAWEQVIRRVRAEAFFDFGVTK